MLIFSHGSQNFPATILVMLKHKISVLDSGLNVIRVPMPSVKSVTVLALCNTGSRYENPDQYGVAHFFEHMVFKGTANFPDAQLLAASIDAVGANFNAFTSKEYTGYYVKSAADHMELAMDVVSDLLLTPKLRQEDIDREKGVIVEELNMYADMPARHIGDLFEQMVFKGSGLEHSIIGNKKTIKGMQQSDFKALLESWYGLGNMVLIIAGDASVVDQDKTLKLVEKMFAKDSKNNQSHHKNKVNVTNPLTSDPISQDRLKVEFKQTEQAHLIMGWPGMKRSDDRRYALALLSTALGGNMSSRLFTEVREKRGLCYYVNSDVDFYHDTGIFGASAGVDPKRVEEAIKVIKSEFEQVATPGDKQITAAELQRAKDYVAGKMVLGLEDSEAVAQFFGMKQLLQNEIVSPEEVLASYNRVTLEEVHQVAADLVKPGELRLAVIGPYKDEAKFKKLIE
jgi:predicted Zn-dependent peptidase